MSINEVEIVFEKAREATFISWPFDEESTCSAKKMAEAGFYFIGNKNEPDAVKCFLCEKSLDGWEPNDDPWMEHLNHSENCQFAKLMTPENALTYEQFLNISKELRKRQLENDNNLRVEIITQEWESFKSDTQKLTNAAKKMSFSSRTSKKN